MPHGTEGSGLEEMVGEVQRHALCRQHGLVLVTLERRTDPPITWAWHQKDDGRWHRFRVNSWMTSRKTGEAG